MLDANLNTLENESRFGMQSCVELDGKSLSLLHIKNLLNQTHFASIAPEIDNNHYFEQSRTVLCKLLADGASIYGVNTMFGGLANQSASCPLQLQKALISAHMSGAGNALPADIVRVAMYLRANSLCHGVSAIRYNIVQRYIDLANKGIVPFVQEFGSIGASGDLVPLSAIAGAVIGHSRDFKLFYQGEFKPATDVLKKLDLLPIALQEKEGLALINGTSVLTAIAAKNALDFVALFDLHLKMQIAWCEVMHADTRSFDTFIHQHRPHPGQIFIAKAMRQGLYGSNMVRDAAAVEKDFANDHLVQDRYSLRCIPQFLGAILEDYISAKKSIEIEMNSATDNPLIDVENNKFLHGGNFLGQHMAMCMDRMRVNIALMAKHNEAQVAQLVEPSFNGGLNASLVSPDQVGNCVGVKPLQILCNSLAPMLEQKAAPLSVHFPIYAEQFNQNLNSQAFGGAQITRDSIQVLTEHTAASLIILCQAVSAKAHQKGIKVADHFSHHTCQLIEKCHLHMGLSGNLSEFPCHPDRHGKYSEWVAKLSASISASGLRASAPLIDESTTL